MINKNNYNWSRISSSNLPGIILFLITIAVFSPVIQHDFINYDDHIYITENPIVSSGLTLKGLVWAFTNISAGFWFPLTWISHMLDCQIFGLNPGGHHLTSLLLHSVNTVMLFYFLLKITDSFLLSLLTASVFAFHPLNVEPVAWASSRKDLLSAFFWIMTMWFYSEYVKQRNKKNYILALIFFSMGLMAKPMLVTLPFILILMDFLPLRIFVRNREYSSLNPGSGSEPLNYIDNLSIKKSIIEKVPFFLLSLTLISLTYIAERGYGSIVSLQDLSLFSRIANTFVSYIGYLYKSIIPLGLSVHYPPYESLSLLRIVSSFFLFIILTLLSIKLRHKYPYLLFGWLWFVITLIPVIGLVQIGSHSMADRYCYIPLIGLSIIFSWGLHYLMFKLRLIKTGILFISITLSSLIILTGTQLSYWEDSILLFRHAVAVNENNLLAHNNLAFALALEGREQEAIKHYSRALGIPGIKHQIHFNLGNAFQSLKNYDKAIVNYKASLALAPDYVNASLNLGTIYYRLKKYDEATDYFMNVLRIDPNHAGAHNNLGVIMLKQNRLEEAIHHFNMALKQDPGNDMALKNLSKIKKGTDLTDKSRFPS